jgi:hypothetical protein
MSETLASRTTLNLFAFSNALVMFPITSPSKPFNKSRLNVSTRRFFELRSLAFVSTCRTAPLHVFVPDTFSSASCALGVCALPETHRRPEQNGVPLPFFPPKHFPHGLGSVPVFLQGPLLLLRFPSDPIGLSRGHDGNPAQGGGGKGKPAAGAGAGRDTRQPRGGVWGRGGSGPWANFCCSSSFLTWACSALILRFAFANSPLSSSAVGSQSPLPVASASFDVPTLPGGLSFDGPSPWGSGRWPVPLVELRPLYI